MTSPRSEIAQPKVGDKAPAFSAATYPSGTASLAEFAGKKNVILAFYPKDDTPGCTKEMCAFSSDLSQFTEANTVVFGVSCDHTESHKSFAAKHNLTVTLLDDSSRAIGMAYGTVADQGALAQRTTFVIDKNGIIQHIHQGMPSNPELLTIVKALS